MQYVLGIIAILVIVGLGMRSCDNLGKNQREEKRCYNIAKAEAIPEGQRNGDRFLSRDSGWPTVAGWFLSIIGLTGFTLGFVWLRPLGVNILLEFDKFLKYGSEENQIANKTEYQACAQQCEVVTTKTNRQGVDIAKNFNGESEKIRRWFDMFKAKVDYSNLARTAVVLLFFFSLQGCVEYQPSKYCAKGTKAGTEAGLRAGYWDGTFDYIGDHFFATIGVSAAALVGVFVLSLGFVAVRRLIIDLLSNIEKNQTRKETLEHINHTPAYNLLYGANFKKLRGLYECVFKPVWAFDAKNVSGSYRQGFNTAEIRFKSLKEKTEQQFKNLVRQSALKKFRIIDGANLRPDQKIELYGKFL